MLAQLRVPSFLVNLVEQVLFVCKIIQENENDDDD